MLSDLCKPGQLIRVIISIDTMAGTSSSALIAATVVAVGMWFMMDSSMSLSTRIVSVALSGVISFAVAFFVLRLLE